MKSGDWPGGGGKEVGGFLGFFWLAFHSAGFTWLR